MFFEKQSMAIDLSSLDFQFTDRDLIATDYRLQNVSQLFLEIDTFHLKCKKLRDDNSKYLGRYLHVPGLFPLDSQQVSFQRGHAEYKLLSNKQIIKNFPSQIRQSTISAAINHARSVKSMAEGLTGSLQFEESEVNLYRSELHKNLLFLSWSSCCF